METKHCTKENPMPENHDHADQHWIHHDVDELEDMDMLGVLFKCNSCGLQFVVRDMP